MIVYNNGFDNNLISIGYSIKRSTMFFNNYSRISLSKLFRMPITHGLNEFEQSNFYCLLLKPVFISDHLRSLFFRLNNFAVVACDINLF